MYDKIEKFCKSKNITIQDLCRKLKISHQSITNMKRRSNAGKKAKLNAENTAKIAEYMGISVSELIE